MLAALNCQGSVYNRIHEIEHWIKSQGDSRPLIAISEFGAELRSLVEGYRWISAGLPHSRVGFLIPTHLQFNVVNCPNSNYAKNSDLSTGLFRLWIRIKELDDKDWFVCSIYCQPGNSGSDLDKGNWIFDQVLQEATEFQKKGYVAILGDFNSHVGKNSSPKGSGKRDHTAARLEGLCNNLDLCATNLLPTTIGSWTRIMNDQKSILDYILIPSERVRDVISSQMHDEEDSGSDHCFVSARVRLKIYSQIEPEPIRWAWNLKKLKNCERTRSLLRAELDRFYDDWLQTASTITEDMPAKINELAEGLTSGILQIWTLVVGKHRTNTETKPWWNADCDSAFRAKQKRFVEYRIQSKRSNSSRTAAATQRKLEAYKTARAEFKRTLRAAKKAYYDELFAEIVDIADSDSRNYSKQLKRFLKRVPKKPAYIYYKDKCESSTQGMLELYRQYFEELLCTPPANADKNPAWTEFVDNAVERLKRSNYIGPIDYAISTEEAMAAYRGTQHGKTGGDDGIISDMIEFDPEALAPVVARLASLALEHGTVPSIWKRGVICPIPKPTNDLNAASNYRGITLLSLLGKWVDKILTWRIQNWIADNNKLSDNQAGFRKAHSTTDFQYVLREVIDNASLRSSPKAASKPLYIAFIDIKKAFDTVWFNGLWFKLQQLGLEGRVLRLYMDWYSQSHSAVQFSDSISQYFQVTQGVKQGAVSSPIFYSLFVDDLVSKINELNTGYHLNDLFVNILLYADDMALIASSPEDLQKMLDALRDFADQWHFEVNADKTKIMQFNDKRRHIWLFDGRAIEVVTEFKYLGIKFSSVNLTRDCRWNSCISDKIEKSASVSTKLNGFAGVSHPDWPIGILAGLWNIYCRPIMLFGAEVIHPANSWIEKLSVIQRQYGRRILALNRHCNGEVVYGELGWLPMQYEFHIAKIRFWVRLNLLPERHLARRVFDAVQGRIVPPGSWLDEVQKILQIYKIRHHDEFTKTPNWKKAIRTKVMKAYQLEWLRSLENSSRLDRYRQIKSAPAMETPIKQGPKKTAQIVIKLRASSNALPVDQLRFNVKRIARHERLCNLCHQGVGDEQHLLLDCPRLSDTREVAFSLIYSALYSQHEHYFARMLASYSPKIQTLTLLGKKPAPWSQKLWKYLRPFIYKAVQMIYDEWVVQTHRDLQ